MLACTAPLVPGELVIGEDIPAEFRYGTENSRLGDQVVWGPGGLLASAPGEGQVYWEEQPVDGPTKWLGWWGLRRVQADTSELWVDGELVATPDGLQAMTAGEVGVFGATRQRLFALEQGWSLPVAGVRRLALGEERLLAVVCAPDCVGKAWTFSGEELGEVVAAGEGGDIAEWKGVAWAGTPAWKEGAAAGKVCSEEGICLEGVLGDHLGAAIAGGYSLGMYNKEITPPRQRIVPLEGGTILSLEQGLELHRVDLTGDGQNLIVGVPFLPHAGDPTGAVIRIIL
ncbi:MAG TPA: hypothetical protein PKY30_04805 [Myxococcota bacterium]|nr:hypothetical protein [Myxococcota bacterium]HNH46330.1 hypothetical protein [Myxococcota bacterium]